MGSVRTRNRFGEPSRSCLKAPATYLVDGLRCNQVTASRWRVHALALTDGCGTLARALNFRLRHDHGSL